VRDWRGRREREKEGGGWGVCLHGQIEAENEAKARNHRQYLNRVRVHEEFTCVFLAEVLQETPGKVRMAGRGCHFMSRFKQGILSVCE
jgi:hypothetical protein